MGDKGGKKDKNKSQQQKKSKEDQKTKKKLDKQHKQTPQLNAVFEGYCTNFVPMYKF